MDSPTTMFTEAFFYISPAHHDQKLAESVQLVGFVFGSLLYTTEAAISKRVFDCSVSDPAPSASGAETEDDDDAAPDEDDSSPDEHELPPSKTSKGFGQAPAAKQRGPNRTWELKEYNQWLRSDHSDAEIMSFIRANLAELNKAAGITSLPPRHYDCKRGDIYGDWMYRHS